MSTTRSQKRKNAQLSADNDVSEGFISPAEVENSSLVEQDTSVVGPSKPKSPRVENSFLESLRASLKEEITSEINNLLAESQREMLKLLKPETRESVRINIDDETENETRSFYTPTKSVRITSTQNNDTNSSRNISHFVGLEKKRKRKVTTGVCVFLRKVPTKKKSHYYSLRFSTKAQTKKPIVDKNYQSVLSGWPIKRRSLTVNCNSPVQ